MSKEYAYVLILNQDLSKILIRKRSDGEFIGKFDFMGKEVDFSDTNIRFPDIPSLGLTGGNVDYNKLMMDEFANEITGFNKDTFNPRWRFLENMIIEFTSIEPLPGYPITYKFAICMFDEQYIDINIIKHDSLYWVEIERVCHMIPFAHSEDNIAKIAIESLRAHIERWCKP